MKAITLAFGHSVIKICCIFSEITRLVIEFFGIGALDFGSMGMGGMGGTIIASAAPQGSRTVEEKGIDRQQVYVEPVLGARRTECGHLFARGRRRVLEELIRHGDQVNPCHFDGAWAALRRPIMNI